VALRLLIYKYRICRLPKQNIIDGWQKRWGEGVVVYCTEYNSIVIKKVETQVWKQIYFSLRFIMPLVTPMVLYSLWNAMLTYRYTVRAVVHDAPSYRQNR